MNQTTPFDVDGSEEPARSEISFVMLANVILDNRRLIVGFSLAFFVLAMAWTLARPATYTASTSFVTQAAGSQAGGLAGIASQFGFSFPVGQAGQTPEFYASLVRSRQLLGSVAETEFTVSDADDPRTRPLADWYGMRSGDEQRRRTATIKALRDRVGVSVSRETGIVGLNVREREPELAAGIAVRLLELLNEFNLEIRQSEAAAERKFIEERIAEVSGDLTTAEDRLEEFTRSNRQYERSPELSFEYDRLQRELALKQQVKTTLAQAYEQARIDEVRNTPVLTVIDQPEVPLLPDRRHLIFKSLVAIVLGAMAGVLVAFGREYAKRDRLRDADAFDRFDALRREAIDDVRVLRARLPGFKS
jgi:uncharacterized protein involved in exopolysaccharide biosynthesis